MRCSSDLQSPDEGVIGLARPRAGASTPQPCLYCLYTRPPLFGWAVDAGLGLGTMVGDDHQSTCSGPDRRVVLVGWLLDVAQEFALRGDTLFRAVYLLDAYLSRQVS